MMSDRPSKIKRVGSFFLLLIGLGAMGVVLMQITKEYQRTKKIDELIAQLQERHDDVEHTNSLLLKEIAYKETDAARERALLASGYQRTGDTYVFVKDGVQQDDQADAHVAPAESRTPPQKWRDILFN